MKATEKQMKARMIDEHYKLLAWISLWRPLSDMSFNHGKFRAAKTLLHWGAITPAVKGEPNRLTPVGDALMQHWVNTHRNRAARPSRAESASN